MPAAARRPPGPKPEARTLRRWRGGPLRTGPRNKNIGVISSAASKLSSVMVSSPSVMTASSPTCRIPAFGAAKMVASTWLVRSILSAEIEDWIVARVERTLALAEDVERFEDGAVVVDPARENVVSRLTVEPDFAAISLEPLKCAARQRWLVTDETDSALISRAGNGVRYERKRPMRNKSARERQRFWSALLGRGLAINRRPSALRSWRVARSPRRRPSGWPRGSPSAVRPHPSAGP